MTNLTAWMIAGFGLAVALALFMRMRTAIAALESTRELAESLAATLGERTKALEKASAKNAKHKGEVDELRRKLEKAKRRAAGKDAAGAGRGTGATRAEADLEAARQERDAARAEASNLAADVARLRAAQREAPPPPRLDDAGIDALEAKLAQAKAALEERDTALATARKRVERLEGKTSKHDMLYASMRSELEAKKDRLKTQQEEIERLRALKVAVGGEADAEAAPE